MADKTKNFDFAKSAGGTKGGSSRSRAKQAAARLNGQKGGRPTGTKTRTLAEFLLRRKLTGEQHARASEGLFSLSTGRGARSEKNQFMKYFGIEGSYVYLGDAIKSTDYAAKKPKTGSPMQLIIQKFRVVARHHLDKK